MVTLSVFVARKTSICIPIFQGLDMEYHVEVNRELSSLSKKEGKVFGLSAEGLLRPAIAERLKRSRGTVNTHFNHILQKLEVENIQQAIAVGFIKGILVCRDKLPMVMFVCGSLTSVYGGLIPSDAYARPANDWSPAPIEQPYRHSRQRGGHRVRSGAQLRLRVQRRKREDG
jgi:DNA-binding CsgD family transcriptional regulator